MAGSGLRIATQINLYEAKSKLSQVVNLEVAGEEIVIAKSGKPKVRLVPVEAKRKRTFGGCEGKGWIADDFDEPLPEDMIEGMYEGIAPPDR